MPTVVPFPTFPQEVPDTNGPAESTEPGTDPGPEPTMVEPPPSRSGDAQVEALLTSLQVAEPASGEDYQRDLFGNGWIDADENRCDTRCEVLTSERQPKLPGLPSGGWVSVYDGYSTDDESELDIDHVVALQEAWRSGAAAWTPDRRIDFANDLDEPLALIAVTSSSNSSKGGQDPAEWRPSSDSAWCEFATAWITVKAKWGLTADAAEVSALRRMIGAC